MGKGGPGMGFYWYFGAGGGAKKGEDCGIIH